MKKIILIFILILFCLLIAGCSSINTSAKSTTDTDYSMGMIIMPDGSIIKGKCEDYMRCSNNWIQVRIDGITYRMNDWRVVIYK